MQFGLKGQKVAVLVANPVPADEVSGPLAEIVAEGADVDLIAAAIDDVEVAVPGDRASGSYPITRTFAGAQPSDYAAVLVPGCPHATHPLADHPQALRFVHDAMEADKPVAAIGKGVAVLAAAGTLEGRTVAAPEELRELVTSAGATWSDQAVEVDQRLTTARSGSDLPGLGRKIAREFANKLDAEKVDSLSLGSFPASDPPPGPVAVSKGATE